MTSGWREWAPALLRGAAREIWPPRCPLCTEVLTGEGEGAFCDGCSVTIAAMTEPTCQKCGRTLPVGGPVSGICGTCELEPPRYDRARIFGVYQGALREAIKDFKFHHRRTMLAALRGLLLEADERADGFEPADVVIPVPLHGERLAARGFNQSADLARAAAGRRKAPLLLDALLRTRPTEPLYGLSASARRRNLRGAFSVARPELVKGRTVLLVDDIITSGATADECARVLKRAGASRVLVLALAAAGGFPHLPSGESGGEEA